MIKDIRFTLTTLLLLAAGALGGELALAPEKRFVPGAKPTPFLRYENDAVERVLVSGSWDRWDQKHAMRREGALWVLDVRPLELPFGRFEYKFLPDGEWEEGPNRILYVNEDHLLERPPGIIIKAAVDAADEINVYLKRLVQHPERLKVWLEPEVPIASWRVLPGAETGYPEGYRIRGGAVTFYFSESTYGHELSRNARVQVAGNFNGWDGKSARWRLRDGNDDGIWELMVPLGALRPPPGEEELLSKFVINGEQWLPPPPGAPNATSDGQGNVNLRIDADRSGTSVIRIKTREPLALDRNYTVAVAGLLEKTLRRMTSPEGVFDRFHSDKALGVTINREQRATTYRLFAPRARQVHLCIYDTPYHAVQEPAFRWLEPAERYPMWKDEADGVWEISLLGLDFGRYYAFNVDGPEGDGEAFNPEAAVGDPYAYAAAHAENNPIVIDREATNRWFGGWTDEAYRTPAPQDVVIYETHVRDLTMHPSSGVPPPLRGTYEGILASEGTGTGLDHLKEIGVNMIEFLPINEFNNGRNGYNWGYTTTYYFAPEASYGRDPLRGSQYYEFKHLVNELHRRGFGVILDVVYNHVGSPNIFAFIDKKYYFRLNPDYTFMNYSGVGNDCRTEAPMMRRLIVDNIVYWMTEYHVDGFRFDLAELIDMKTMEAIRDAARAINPNVLLISEPWSLRGENKHELTGTGWSAWNNDFRYAAKNFVAGVGDRQRMQDVILGSVRTWAANPLQPVNYVESHDDMALADELSTAPGHDGRRLIETDVQQNLLAATIVFTSLGIPMIGEGQEFLRSKHGISNTYNRGDRINALNWDDRNRPLAATALAYYRGLIRLRTGPKGAAFRVAERPPEGYYRWIRPENDHALGYIVNAPQIHKGAGFVVLLNASADAVRFRVPFPPGRWRRIADGERIDVEGLTNAPVVPGPQEVDVRVPGIGSAIFMDGF